MLLMVLKCYEPSSRHDDRQAIVSNVQVVIMCSLVSCFRFPISARASFALIYGVLVR
jgi:hypothetical protein